LIHAITIWRSYPFFVATLSLSFEISIIQVFDLAGWGRVDVEHQLTESCEK
jgi:hypothetical protein